MRLLVHWVERHPRTMTWILLTTSANFLLNLLIAIGVFR